MTKAFVNWMMALPLRQLVRFAIVGIISNLVGYLIYLVITWLGVGPKLAVSLLYPIGTYMSFAGNKSWTFNSSEGNLGTGTKHIIVYALGYVLNLILLYVFVDNLGFAHQLVQFLAIFVVALFLFISMKFFVFAEPNKE